MIDKKINPRYVGNPLRIPLVTGCVIWLMLDRFDAPPLVQGICWTLYAVFALLLACAPFCETWVKPKL